MLVKRIMAKRKTTTDIPFEDVMTDINNWLDKDDDDKNDAQDDLDELYDENEEIRDADNPTDQEVLREKLDKENDEEKDNEGQPSRPSRYSVPRKKLTQKRLLHDIYSSLDENTFQNITCVTKDGNFEELTGYLRSKKDKNTKKLFLLQNIPHLLAGKKDVILSQQELAF